MVSSGFFIMKDCRICKQTKDLSQFHKGAGRPCKPCQAVIDQERSRTPIGLVKRIYSNQRTTTKKMGRSLPAYTFDELCDWLDKQPEFALLYHAWVASDYDKDLVPSIDRKDNTQSYNLNNIQLVTWRQNLLNQKAQNKDGTYLHPKSKAVRQLTIEGDVVATYPSVGIAMRKMTGSRANVSNITMVCAGKYQTAYGFRWEWA